jgi:hypothetical protein
MIDKNKWMTARQTDRHANGPIRAKPKPHNSSLWGIT